MSNTKFDTLRNVAKGRTDWKVKARIIREWRGYTRTGQRLNGYNLLLLDSKVIYTFHFVSPSNVLSFKESYKCFVNQTEL